MIAIKASYINGKIILIDKIPEQISYAKLTVIVDPVDQPDQMSVNREELVVSDKDSYEEYKLIGLDSFFNTTDDKQINWEEYFGLR